MQPFRYRCIFKYRIINCLNVSHNTYFRYLSQYVEGEGDLISALYPLGDCIRVFVQTVVGLPSSTLRARLPAGETANVGEVNIAHTLGCARHHPRVRDVIQRVPCVESCVYDDDI